MIVNYKIGPCFKKSSFFLDCCSWYYEWGQHFHLPKIVLPGFLKMWKYWKHNLLLFLRMKFQVLREELPSLPLMGLKSVIRLKILLLFTKLVTFSICRGQLKDIISVPFFCFSSVDHISIVIWFSPCLHCHASSSRYCLTNFWHFLFPLLYIISLLLHGCFSYICIIQHDFSFHLFCTNPFVSVQYSIFYS